MKNWGRIGGLAGCPKTEDRERRREQSGPGIRMRMIG